LKKQSLIANDFLLLCDIRFCTTTEAAIHTVNTQTTITATNPTTTTATTTTTTTEEEEENVYPFLKHIR